MDIDIVTAVRHSEKFVNTVFYKPLLHQIYNLDAGGDRDELIRIDLRSKGQRSRSHQQRHTDEGFAIEDHVVYKCCRFFSV